MKLGNLTTKRQKKRDVAPPKMAWAGIATSVALHAVGFAALVTWSSTSTNSHVRFVGREQAFQFMLSFTQPQWDGDPVTLDDFETDLPVVIEPNKARIGKRAYIHSPTVKISLDGLSLDSAIDSTQQLPKLATPDDVYDVAEQPVPKTPTTEYQRTNPQTSRQTSNSSVSVPLSNSASNFVSNSGSPEEIPPDFSQNTPPTYPSPAIQSGWEGTVLLRVWIDETGRVTKVKVARTSGYRILDGAAATAVRQWIATPANRGGKPVATIKLLPVQFQLPLETNKGILP